MSISRISRDEDRRQNYWSGTRQDGLKYREAARVIEPPSDVGCAMIKSVVNHGRAGSQTNCNAPDCAASGDAAVTKKSPGNSMRPARVKELLSS
jgi:hypothetical protein